MWFVIIIALAIIIGIVIHKNAEKEKAQKYREEQERKEHQEKVNRERLEREKQEKKEMDHFCQALSTNPIITTAVPAIAVQCAQYLVEESKNEKYLKKEYRLNSGYSNICISYLKDSKESFDSIHYATYGFPSIENDKKQKQMERKAAEAFEISLKSELSKYGLTYKTYCEPKKYYYCGICYTHFCVTCEIGVLQSW